MKATIFGLIALLVSGIAQAEPFTNRQAAEFLSKSVVSLTRGWSDEPSCTASKIGPKTFITAAHCVKDMSSDLKVRRDFDWAQVQTILFPVTKGSLGKDGKENRRDWAILYTAADLDKVEPLNFGCHEELYQGQKVAYMGFPYPVRSMFAIGYVGSIGPHDDTRSGADIVVDIPANGGASGAPVISMDTGNIIGLITEAVQGTHSIFMTGLESIRSTDKCMALEKEQEDAKKALQQSGSK